MQPCDSIFALRCHSLCIAPASLSSLSIELHAHTELAHAFTMPHNFKRANHGDEGPVHGQSCVTVGSWKACPGGVSSLVSLACNPLHKLSMGQKSLCNA